MKKVIKVENMDCAVCAKKLETAVSKLDGVKSVNVNFMAGKMTLDYDETAFVTINLVNDVVGGRFKKSGH